MSLLAAEQFYSWSSSERTPRSIKYGSGLGCDVHWFRSRWHQAQDVLKRPPRSSNSFRRTVCPSVTSTVAPHSRSGWQQSLLGTVARHWISRAFASTLETGSDRERLEPARGAFGQKPPRVLPPREVSLLGERNGT